MRSLGRDPGCAARSSGSPVSVTTSGTLERADLILLLAPFDQFRRYRHTGYEVALFVVERS